MSLSDSVLRTMGKLMHTTNTQGVIDYPLNEKNRDHLCTTLIDFNYSLNAVFIVSRPVKDLKQSSFQHWEVKIIASPILLSMGFVECNKKGAFKLDQTMTNQSDVDDFLFYYQNGQRFAYNIVSHAIPKLNEKNEKSGNKNSDNNVGRYINRKINCKKKVCDIADFIEMWSSNIKYNAIVNNCQHFAVDLFAYLVKYQYPLMVNSAIDKLDPASDKTKYLKQKKSFNVNNDNNIDDEKTEIDK